MSARILVCGHRFGVRTPDADFLGAPVAEISPQPMKVISHMPKFMCIEGGKAFSYPHPCG